MTNRLGLALVLAFGAVLFFTHVLSPTRTFFAGIERAMPSATPPAWR